MSFVQLREYQEEALQEIVKALSEGINKQLIVLPTGSGKTILMAALAKYFNKRTLILAHREELIQQAFDKFKLYWPEADIGICKAERAETNHQIVIGSVQSCCKPKRLAHLKDSEFNIFLIDEAHHATAESYQKIIKIYRKITQSNYHSTKGGFHRGPGVSLVPGVCTGAPEGDPVRVTFWGYLTV